jgi:hypothetical protein
VLSHGKGSMQGYLTLQHLHLFLGSTSAAEQIAHKLSEALATS